MNRPLTTQYGLITSCTIGLLLACHILQGQDLGLEVKKAFVTVDSITYAGYISELEFPLKTVQKEWWRYTKRFSVLDNRKSHYIHSIPPKKGESNTAIKYISVSGLDEVDSIAYLKLALKPDDMNPEDFRKNRLQASEILVDFQIHFYSNFVQKHINKKEKEASRLSAQLDRYNKKILSLKNKLKSPKGDHGKVKKEISANQKKKSKINTQLRTLQSEIDYMKKRLTEIK